MRRRSSPDLTVVCGSFLGGEPVPKGTARARFHVKEYGTTPYIHSHLIVLLFTPPPVRESWTGVKQKSSCYCLSQAFVPSLILVTCYNSVTSTVIIVANQATKDLHRILVHPVDWHNPASVKDNITI